MVGGGEGLGSGVVGEAEELARAGDGDVVADVVACAGEGVDVRSCLGVFGEADGGAVVGGAGEVLGDVGVVEEKGEREGEITWSEARGSVFLWGAIQRDGRGEDLRR